MLIGTAVDLREVHLVRVAPVTEIGEKAGEVLILDQVAGTAKAVDGFERLLRDRCVGFGDEIHAAPPSSSSDDWLVPFIATCEPDEIRRWKEHDPTNVRGWQRARDCTLMIDRLNRMISTTDEISACDFHGQETQVSQAG